MRVIEENGDLYSYIKFQAEEETQRGQERIKYRKLATRRFTSLILACFSLYTISCVLFSSKGENVINFHDCSIEKSRNGSVYINGDDWCKNKVNIKDGEISVSDSWSETRVIGPVIISTNILMGLSYGCMSYLIYHKKLKGIRGVLTMFCWVISFLLSFASVLLNRGVTGEIINFSVDRPLYINIELNIIGTMIILISTVLFGIAQCLFMICYYTRAKIGTGIGTGNGANIGIASRK